MEGAGCSGTLESHCGGSATPCCLPLHLLADAVLTNELSHRDLAAAASVCKSWRAAAEQDSPWRAARARDFPAANEATVLVLRGRAISTLRQQQQPCSTAGVERLIYRWLSQAAACERCGQQFTDAVNTPTSCQFHPGILFSGGQLNGAGLRFTCCNRRAHHIPNGSRDGNGCATAFHAGGGSAWQRHGAGVKPRELLPAASNSGPSPAGSSSTSGSSSAGFGISTSGSPPRQPSLPYPWVSAGRESVEWHPNQRPGLLELPSRLLFGGA